MRPQHPRVRALRGTEQAQQVISPVQGVWLTTSHEDQQPEQEIDGRNVKEVKAACFCLKVYGCWKQEATDEDRNSAFENERKLLGNMVILLPIEEVVIQGDPKPAPLLNKAIAFAVRRAICKGDFELPKELREFAFDIDQDQLKVDWTRGEKLQLKRTPIRNDNWVNILNFVRTRNAGDILEADIQLTWQDENTTPEIW